MGVSMWAWSIKIEAAVFPGQHHVIVSGWWVGR